MTKCAFAPAHVTGLFAVHDLPADPLQKGSRGAGWCIEQGAWAAVTEADETTFTLNGRAGDAAVTAAALFTLAPDHAFDVDLRLDLATGQGFGMSAAGTLAACLAAASLIDVEPEHALEATHRAEVENGTGLGDAVGSWFGAAELRLKPGCPPHGWAMQVHPHDETEFLFCQLGGELATASIIRDEEWKTRTRRHGDEAVDRILEAGRHQAWHLLLEESNRFSRELGLMPPDMLALGQRLPGDVQWGQVMLGNTLWVAGDAGDLERAEALLEGHGPLFRGRVDPNGARLVRAVPPLSS